MKGIKGSNKGACKGWGKPSWYKGTGGKGWWADEKGFSGKAKGACYAGNKGFSENGDKGGTSGIARDAKGKGKVPPATVEREGTDASSQQAGNTASPNRGNKSAFSDAEKFGIPTVEGVAKLFGKGQAAHVEEPPASALVEKAAEADDAAEGMEEEDDPDAQDGCVEPDEDATEEPDAKRYKSCLGNLGKTTVLPGGRAVHHSSTCMPA